MTNDTFEAHQAQYSVATLLETEVLSRNKKTVFDALAAAGIALVVTNFDGSSDSGQFEGAACFDDDNKEVAFPARQIEVEDVDYTAVAIVRRTTTIREFIDDMACNLLEGTYRGWENNDGAYGEFRLAVARQSITLEYNERYTTSNYYEHQF